MFEPTYIKVFMGGKFTIKEPPRTAKELAETFQSWAEECRGWGEEEISEVAILRDELTVTLKTGIAQ